VSESLRLLAIIAPIAIATGVTAYIARGLVARAGLAATMVAIAVVASLVTVVDLVVLNHYMLIAPGNRTEMGLVVVYSLSAGVAAALIVGHSTTRALRRIANVADRLGENDLDARVGELHASPELRKVGAALDLAAARIADLIETDRRTEASRRDLITSISHDLRTPLANLRAMVEAINEGVVDDPDVVRSYAEEMLRSITTLVAMVEDMFELSQIDAVSLRSDARSIPVGEAVRQAIDACRLEAQARMITVTADVGGADGAACSARLTRVVHSLVDNAVRYTPPGGTVRIAATSAADSVQVTVDDSGPGLTAVQRSEVFEPFWRGDSSRSSRGSGLGLTLARRITSALGGEIRVSESSGGGASFAVVLPTSHQPRSPAHDP
jgi:signal transduction histidine kinase